MPSLVTSLFSIAGYEVTLALVIIVILLLLLFSVLAWSLTHLNVAKHELAENAFVEDLGQQEALNIVQFSKALPLTDERVNIYLALGNLYRQRGEIEQAVALRQAIITHAEVSVEHKVMALYELGLDFRKSGVLNQALDIFNKLMELAPYHVPTGRQIVYIYEEMRAWEKAFAARKKVDSLLREVSKEVLAHYRTEFAKNLVRTNRLDQAEAVFAEAIKINKYCLDAYLHLGDLYLSQNRNLKALDLWIKAVTLAPEFGHLSTNRAINAGGQVLKEYLATLPPEKLDPLSLLALAKAQKDDPAKALALADIGYEKALRFIPLHFLRSELLLDIGAEQQIRHGFRDFLRAVGTVAVNYRCDHCGLISPFLSWQCPRCHHWDTISADLASY